MGDTPHRVVDDVLNGIASGVTGLITSGASAIKNTGRTITSALDKPFQEVTGKEGPIKMLDPLGEGIVDAGVNFVDDGIIGTAKIAKEGVMEALDQPTEQIGFPPKLGAFQLFKGGK